MKTQTSISHEWEYEFLKNAFANYINILKNTSQWTLGLIQGIKYLFNIWKLIYYNKLKKKNYGII